MLIDFLMHFLIQCICNSTTLLHCGIMCAGLALVYKWRLASVTIPKIKLVFERTGRDTCCGVDFHDVLDCFAQFLEAAVFEIIGCLQEERHYSETVVFVGRLIEVRVFFVVMNSVCFHRKPVRNLKSFKYKANGLKKFIFHTESVRAYVFLVLVFISAVVFPYSKVTINNNCPQATRNRKVMLSALSQMYYLKNF